MPGGDKESDSNLVSLDDIVKKFVKSDEMEDMDKKLKTIQKKNLDVKVLWDEVTCDSEDAGFPKLEDDIKSSANRRMLHTQTFTNNTSTNQVYSYKTSSRKMSSCERSYQEGCTMGKGIGVTLKVPSEVLEVNMDLRQELSLMETESFNKEDEISWEVESQITVPSKHLTIAELTVSEKQYCVHFVIESILKGDVIVDYKNLATGEVFSSSYINIATIVKYALGKKLLKAEQFQVVGEEDAVRTRFKGTCTFSKGVGDIKLTEKSLVSDGQQVSAASSNNSSQPS
ncbi:uncharacterized protein LOC135488686 [Lineus longissimus]|uniref:uncharacterized protein LOC135488686 n=1 Tax=Lineus longissimus TaxID=88925 RepID=UPI00315C508C